MSTRKNTAADKEVAKLRKGLEDLKAQARAADAADVAAVAADRLHKRKLDTT